MINKKINRLYTVFLIIGIIITSIGLYTTIKTLDNSNKVDTIGTITSIVSTSSDTPDVYVTYNVNGKRYTSVMSGYSSTFYEGKKIDIYYMKNDPNIIGNKKLELLILKKSNLLNMENKVYLQSPYVELLHHKLNMQ